MNKKLTYLLLTLLSFAYSSCEKKESTPDWVETKAQQQESQLQGKPKPKPSVTVEQPISSVKTHSSLQEEANAGEIKFMYYNLRNYLTMRRGDTERPKPEHEIKALINNIKKVNPEILAVCEIGNKADLTDFTLRLKQAGIDYQHSYLTMGSDPTRRQAILSRYPIVPHPVPKRTYRLNGIELEVKRGILDATITTPKGSFRVLGAHLKSKRPNKKFDHNLVRRNEALILRKHATSLLSASTAKLIVYGDMNDTKNSPPLRTIKGPYDGKLSLRAIDLEASDGTRWTQHWSYQDVYSRFDFALVSEAMSPHIDRAKSYILEVPKGDPASDHRALVLIIR